MFPRRPTPRRLVRCADRGYVGVVAAKTIVRQAAMAATLLVPALALAHARLVWPPPRTTTILKTPPCGGLGRSGVPTILAPGQPLEVEWVETVDHPGHYEIAFSPADDLGFVTLLGNVPDQAFASGATERTYSATIDVPSTPCGSCTLQLIQFMSDHPPGSQYYYSCADIQIVFGATTTTSTSAPDVSTTSTTAVPAVCAGLASYDRARCLVADATSHPICAGEPLDARLQRALDGGFEAVQRRLDQAVTPETSLKRTRRFLEAALHRIEKMRRKVVAAGDHGRIGTSCAQALVARLDAIRAAIETLVS
jgi:hypothetical protein